MTAEQASRAEQRDRYRELLEELRTTLPGVQVLFAFLLTVPFSRRFTELDSVGRGGYFVTLLSALASIVLLMAPMSFHRVAPRQERRRRLRTGIATAIAGMAALVVSMVSALYVITRFVFGPPAALVVAGVLVAGFGVLWYALPLRERLRHSDE